MRCVGPLVSRSLTSRHHYTKGLHMQLRPATITAAHNILTNLNADVGAMPFADFMQHIATLVTQSRTLCNLVIADSEWIPEQHFDGEFDTHTIHEDGTEQANDPVAFGHIVEPPEGDEAEQYAQTLAATSVEEYID